MNYNQALDYIHSQKRFGPKPGLERIKKLLSLLGDPQDQLRFVHVAGTNGKGSTTVMTARVLEEAGYRAGCFISPFVLDFRERFQINREMMPEGDLVRLVERVKPHLEEMRQNGEIVAEFELVTTLGMMYFQEQNCDVVCLETGIGGRFDATNAISAPLAAVITAISYDHTDILGDTLEEIAAEKAGIIKRGTDVVCYPLQPPEALAVLMEQCARAGSRLILPNMGAVQIHETTPSGSAFSYGGAEYRLRLAGRHQVYNALSVIETIGLLRQKGISVTEEQLAAGLEKASFPARFEVVSENPLVILDGAHNPGGAKALAEAMKLIRGRKAAIVGMLKDKEYEALLREIGPQCEKLIAVEVKSPRALDKETLCETAKGHCPDCVTAESYEEALRLAADAVGKEGTVLICGSLYLAAEIRPVVRVRDRS